MKFEFAVQHKDLSLMLLGLFYKLSIRPKIVLESNLFIKIGFLQIKQKFSLI